MEGLGQRVDRDTTVSISRVGQEVYRKVVRRRNSIDKKVKKGKSSYRVTDVYIGYSVRELGCGKHIHK
jgi:hypothetical protein